MGLLDGKVAIITGAGGGHRARARAPLREGGGARSSSTTWAATPRRHSGRPSARARRDQVVVDEIRAAGGTGVANHDSVATAEAGAASS